MIANTKIGASFTASFDCYYFYNSFKDKFDNISYFNPYNSNYVGKSKELTDEYNALNGVIIKNCFKCEIVESIKNVNEIIKLNVDMYIFTERCILFNLYYEFEKQHDIILDKITYLHTKNIKIKKNNAIIPMNVGAHLFNEFLVNMIFKMNDSENSITNIMAEVDPFETYYNSSNIAHTRTKEKLGLDTDIFGSTFTGAQIFVTDFTTISILDNKKLIDTNNLKKISTKYDLYYDKEKKIILTHDEDHFFKKHMPNILKYRLYEQIIKSYSQNFIKGWYSYIEETANELIDNLDNDNEVFWRKFRTDIEKSQLRFLSSNIRFNKILKQIKKLGYEHVYDKKFRDEFIIEIENDIFTTKEHIKEIKYGLDNIATPGHTHDEQLLQQVTEKGNERILLLSFLAMSIPMIGAILSPNLEIQTKLISAFVLTLLPISYIIFSKFSNRRKHNRNISKFLNKGYQDLSLTIKNMKKEKESLEKRNDEEAKLYIPLIQQNLKLCNDMLKKLEKRMK